MKYANHFKRILAMVLCVCMVLGMAPLSALAAEENAAVTLYFHNTDNWSTVNIYYWSDSSTTMTTWPGEAMRNLGNGFWAYDVPEDAVHVIFNNGSTQTGDLTIPADGNCYVRSTDSWSVYTPGTVKLYFNNTANWSTVNIYYWSGSLGNLTIWPGEAMTAEGNGIWSFDVPANAEYVIFNDASTQTGDLTIPADGNCYTLSTNSWSVYPSAGGGEEEASTGYAVDIGGTVTTYTDFDEALDAACAAEAATLKLYQDVPEGLYNTSGGNVTLDLNGKTVGGRILLEECTLTITDTAEVKGTIENYLGTAFNYYSGKLIILDTADCTGEAEGHEPWRIGRTQTTAADAGTIGSTGTEDIVIPADMAALRLFTDTVETILPEAGQDIYLHRHTWTEATCSVPKTCTGCGAIEGEAASEKHDWVDATCTVPKTCSVCGSTEGEALGHSFGDGICTGCGLSDKPLTINMYDVYGDGWNGNGIMIYMGGEYVTTVTLEDGEAGVWTGDYFPSKEYIFRWNRGSYPDECSFEILIGDEQVFAASTNDCWGYDDDYRFYPVCEHNYNVIASGERTCTINGFACYECTGCGHSYWEYDYATGHSFSEDGICSVCSYEAESLLTIKMYDSEGDGWNGNRLLVNDLDMGTIEVTLNEGEADVWMWEYDPDVITKIFWMNGTNPEECAFEILIDDEQVFKAEFGDCSAYHDDFQLYPVCEHSFSKLTQTLPTCTEKGYTVFQCDLCGNRYTEESAALGHDYGEDGICTGCGDDKNTIVIDMYDSGYDGWNGNAIEICINGEHVDYITFDDGESAVWTDKYDPTAEYEFYWAQGLWPEECSFTITICDEVVFTATEDDCAAFDETYRFYPVCEHNYTAVRVQAPTCTADGYTVYTCGNCNHSYEDDYVVTTGHSFGEDDICTVCGERKYIVVFFRNDLMWTDVRVQYSGSKYVEDTTGSGKPMEFYFNDGTYDFYVAEIPSDIQTLHFTGVLNDALQTSPDEYYYEWWDGCAFYINDYYLWYGRLDYITECDHKYNRNPDESDCNHEWRCSVCYDTLKEAGHSFGSDGICTACGIDPNNAIVIDMEDSYGDGWNQNAIDVYADGEYVVTVTLYTGKTGNWLVEYDPAKEYKFFWVQGDWPSECSFTITIRGEKVFTATQDDCDSFADGYCFYSFASGKNGIVAEDGKLYYYENDVRTYAGLIEIDGDYYYVRTSGEVVTGRCYWITKTNDLLPAANYYFDETGKLGDKNGFIEENGGIYYYEDGQLVYAGLIEVDGDYYYVRSSGQVITDRHYWITKTNDLLPADSYYFDEEGKLYPPVEEVKSGIYQEGDKLYYYENNQRTYAGLIEIDGNYYYVRTSGEVVSGRTYWITKTNDLLPVGNYEFDENGVMTNPPA